MTPGQARRVRAAIRRLIRENGGDHGGGSAVARLLDLTPSAISQIDSEKNAPSFGTAQRVATALGVTVSSLLGET